MRLPLTLGSTFRHAVYGAVALLAAGTAVAQEAVPAVVAAPVTVDTVPGPPAAAAMKPYTQRIEGTEVEFDMVPIPGGEFLMGSPEAEEGHEEAEGPQHRVKLAPFWMGKCEVTWDEYDVWSFNLDIQRRKLAGIKASAYDTKADAVTRPTKPYTDMTFDMGHDDFPAICMTQLAAKMYCRWLSEKTGQYYRLPTEAEWEYACRAGTGTAYSFGDDPAGFEEYGWCLDNSDYTYHPVGQKKPNPWGLFDMHGNVAEWCLDQYDPTFYASFLKDDVTEFPINVPKSIYPRTVRGGSWDQDVLECRSASRLPSTDDWKAQDPQIPKSIWYHTDALHVGFRVVRPTVVPDEQTRLTLQLEPRPEDVPEWGMKEGHIHVDE